MEDNSMRDEVRRRAEALDAEVVRIRRHFHRLVLAGHLLAHQRRLQGCLDIVHIVFPAV